ncbi:hypothetical protein [Flammeovirga agarivorans]|uniref:Uncharacterized protein n=1 Tax=Flammeovirga agarivorans TaxID=2726742 RepID=A0A7X8SIT6_9BACT|nr:hypothetical protein [Flammeovirga agarivorans]NLR90989.1 hypothetical protein [Flammeovirga agarivorans]
MNLQDQFIHQELQFEVSLIDNNELFEDIDFIDSQYSKEEEAAVYQDIDDQIFEEFMNTFEDDFMI